MTHFTNLKSGGWASTRGKKKHHTLGEGHVLCIYAVILRVHIHTCVHLFTYMYIIAYTCVYIYMYIYIHYKSIWIIYWDGSQHVVSNGVYSEHPVTNSLNTTSATSKYVFSVFHEWTTHLWKCPKIWVPSIIRWTGHLQRLAGCGATTSSLAGAPHDGILVPMGLDR